MQRPILIAMISAAAIAMSPLAIAQQNIDLRPTNIEPNQRDSRATKAAQDEITKLKDLIDKIDKASNGKLNPNSTIDLSGLKDYGITAKPDIAGALQIALNLMQEFGIIDPRENAIQPDLNP